MFDSDTFDTFADNVTSTLREDVVSREYFGGFMALAAIIILIAVCVFKCKC